MVPKDTKKTNIDVKRAHISEILHNYPLDEVASIFSSILSVTHLLCSKNTFFFLFIKLPILIKLVYFVRFLIGTYLYSRIVDFNFQSCVLLLFLHKDGTCVRIP